jgi:precorrin-6B methylase 1
VTVLVSGDPGLCSLAKPIVARFGCVRCRVIPGISSVQVAFSRLGLDWMDAVFLTAHGRNLRVSPEECRRFEKIAILAGGAESWPQIVGFVKQMEALGGRRDVYVFENLTLPDERVRRVGTDEIESGIGLPEVWFCWFKPTILNRCVSMNRTRRRIQYDGHLCRGGTGDPELLTVKAQRLLRECRVCVYAGSLVSPQVLALLPAGAERHDSASMHLEEIVTVFRRAHETVWMWYGCTRVILPFMAQSTSRCASWRRSGYPMKSCPA